MHSKDNANTLITQEYPKYMNHLSHLILWVRLFLPLIKSNYYQDTWGSKWGKYMDSILFIFVRKDRFVFYIILHSFITGSYFQHHEDDKTTRVRYQIFIGEKALIHMLLRWNETNMNKYLCLKPFRCIKIKSSNADLPKRNYSTY